LHLKKQRNFLMQTKYLKALYFKIVNTSFQRKYYEDIVKNRYLTILNLHRVSYDKNFFYPSLSPELFEELLKFITKEFNVITFQEIEEYKNSKKPNLILSFDDGFYDFLEYAVPLLEKYKIVVNQNVIPLCIETGQPVWDVMLGDILNQVPMIEINKIDFPDFKMKLTSQNQTQFALALTKYFKQYPTEQRELLWDFVEEIAEKYNVQYTRMLNKKEVLEIAQIHEIGAHSYSHESMGIESDTFFENDFLKCQKYFQNELKLPLDIYAFPSGSYKENYLKYLKEKGIKHLLLVNETYSRYDSNIFNRFTFYGESKSEIWLRALGWTR